MPTWIPIEGSAREKVSDKVNASEVNTRSDLTSCCMCHVGTVVRLQVPCCARVRQGHCFASACSDAGKPDLSVVGSLWWVQEHRVAAPEAQLAVSSPHAAGLYSTSCPQTQRRLGNADLELKKEEKDVPNCPLLYHVLILCFCLIHFQK